jgi:hypothetical protein
MIRSFMCFAVICGFDSLEGLWIKLGEHFHLLSHVCDLPSAFLVRKPRLRFDVIGLKKDRGSE